MGGVKQRFVQFSVHFRLVCTSLYQSEKLLGATDPAFVQIRIEGNTVTFGKKPGHLFIRTLRFLTPFLSTTTYMPEIYVDHEHKKISTVLSSAHKEFNYAKKIEELDRKITRCKQGYQLQEGCRFENPSKWCND